MRASQCPRCRLTIENVDGIPLLVRDRQAIEAIIAEARQQGLDAWYTKPQLGQWAGPYRHHVIKRKQWVEGVIGRAGQRAVAAEPSVGLDLGCGDGYQSSTGCSPISLALYGSDYNLLRLLRAAKLGIDARLFMADICNYPAEDDCFDVIFFNHVLGTHPGRCRRASGSRRILKPGAADLGVPNEGAAFWQLAYRLQPKIRATSDHQHFYTANSVAAQCKAAGLTVRESSSDRMGRAPLDPRRGSPTVQMGG